MGKTTYLEPDQITIFLEGIPDLRLRKMSHKQVKLMFEVLFYAAMRISEVLQIRPSNLESGKIRLDETKGGFKRCECSKWAFRPTRLLFSDKDCRKCQGTGKYRIPAYAYVIKPVYDDLLALAKITPNNGLLFPISRVRAWQYANQILGCRTHTFRHSFLTYLLDKGLDIRDIMNKARHKNLATTSTYIEKNTDYSRTKEEAKIERL